LALAKGVESMVTVALVHCMNYDDGAVTAAVNKGLDLLGGVQRFVAPGEHLLLKPNLLAADPPHKCVTTHPLVFKAVAQSLKAAGAKLSYGDSPALGSMERAAEKAGLAAVAAQLGIKAADFMSSRDVFFERGHQHKRFSLAQGVLASDGVISLPKLKTHALERITGAVKNQFGCIAGMRKSEFHLKIPDAQVFAKMLLDLNALIAPRLYIMDGIQAMEGNGPRGGRPRLLQVLLFADDPIALDATVCRIIGLDPAFVPTVKWGQHLKLGFYHSEAIRLVGDPLTRFHCPDFDVPRKPVSPFRSQGYYRWLSQHLVDRPVMQPRRCIRCGLCIQVCPATPKAIDWLKVNKDMPPRHNYTDCIRCYCCQELCPQSAIVLKRPGGRRLLDRLHKLLGRGT
jgi:uncharacterized protein (DUF362 family)/Pyruvate/2-oxoacid:ferredoxin oxidoreductase delta subunit